MSRTSPTTTTRRLLVAASAAALALAWLLQAAAQTALPSEAKASAAARRIDVDCDDMHGGEGGSWQQWRQRRLQLFGFGLSLAQELGDSIINGDIDQAAEILVDAVRGGESGSVVRGLSMANDKPGVAQTIVRALGLGLDSNDLENAVETGGQEEPEAADVVRDVLVVIDGNFVPGTQTADGQVILENGSPAFPSGTYPPSQGFVGGEQAPQLYPPSPGHVNGEQVPQFHPPSTTFVDDEQVPGLSNATLPQFTETPAGTTETTQDPHSQLAPAPEQALEPPIVRQDRIVADGPDPDTLVQPEQQIEQQPELQMEQQREQQIGQQPEQEPEELQGQLPTPPSPSSGTTAFVNGVEARPCRGQKEEQCCAEFSNTDFNAAASNNDLSGCLCDFTRQCRFEFINEHPPIIMDTRRPDLRSCMCP